MNDNNNKHIQELFVDGTAIDRALKRAVQEALLQHRRAGFPIAEWRDGKVVWVPPEEIPLPEHWPLQENAIEERATNGKK